MVALSLSSVSIIRKSLVTVNLGQPNRSIISNLTWFNVYCNMARLQRVQPRDILSVHSRRPWVMARDVDFKVKRPLLINTGLARVTYIAEYILAKSGGGKYSTPEVGIYQ